MKNINIDNVQTVKNYAYDKRVTVPTIYRHIKEGKLKGVNIDGVQFVVLQAGEVKK